MKITLLGYMGAGKSTLAQHLAVSQHLPLLDLDTEIEKESGYTITETIFNKGELYFRKLEHDKLNELLDREKFVLCTGGGTPCYFDNIDVINRKSLSIYLQYGVSDLYERLKDNTANRPLIAHLEGEQLKEFIGKHLFERTPFYDKATITIKGAGKSQEQILKEITSILHE